MLFDGATHQPVDVLPDRRSTTLETWLRAHSGVEFVVRDGSATYAEAIRRGAPTAIEVADRWHLWHLRREALIDCGEVGDLRLRPVAAGR